MSHKYMVILNLRQCKSLEISTRIISSYPQMVAEQTYDWDLCPSLLRLVMTAWPPLCPHAIQRYPSYIQYVIVTMELWVNQNGIIYLGYVLINQLRSTF